MRTRLRNLYDRRRFRAADPVMVPRRGYGHLPDFDNLPKHVEPDHSGPIFVRRNPQALSHP